MIIFLQTFIVAAIGSTCAYYIGAPAPFLTGPASFVSVLSLFGLKTQIPDRLRDAVFLIIGLILGTSVTPDTLKEAGTWPVSLVMMCITVALTMVLGAAMISRFLDVDRRSALLAASPGHLSFVLGFSTDIGANTALVSVIQSMRLLILTLLVPIAVALLTDADLSKVNVVGPLISVTNFAILAVIAGITGFGMLKIKVPAAYLIGGMLISTLGHGSNLTPGEMPFWLTALVFTIMGALIGTRFSGVSLKTLRQAALAGIGITFLGMGIVIIAALIVAQFTDLKTLSLIIALAPGGFETMAAMSAVVGADPAFVTFHHIARLFFLSLFVPFMLRHKSAQG